MKKFINSILAVMIFMVGCTDLDDVLYDRIPEDAYVADPVLQMSPIYRPMQDFLDWSGWWFAQEITGDAVVIPIRGEHWNDEGKWVALHKHTWTNETEAIAGMWGRFYEGVVAANRFIETQAPFAGDEVVDQAIAKARILRAYYYYLLIDNYGDVPYVTQFMDAPARPTKTPRAEVFNAIVQEVEESILLIAPQTSKTAVTPAVGHAVLAKLYLNAQVYTGTAMLDKAEEHIDAVLSLGFTLESNPLAPFLSNNQESSENMWVIPYHEDNYQGFNLHMRTLHYQSNQTFRMAVGPWNGLAALESFFKGFDDNDSRKNMFLVGQQFSAAGEALKLSSGQNVVLNPVIPALEMQPGTSSAAVIELAGARFVKFEVKMGAKENLGNHFPVFRLADFILMKAEVLIRRDGAGAGDAYINQIRQRAGLNAITGATLADLLKERGKELVWEGHRRQDMIRFGEFTKAWWEKEVTSSDRNIFPIPQWAVESNPNLLD